MREMHMVTATDLTKNNQTANIAATSQRRLKKIICFLQIELFSWNRTNVRKEEGDLQTMLWSEGQTEEGKTGKGEVTLVKTTAPLDFSILPPTSYKFSTCL